MGSPDRRFALLTARPRPSLPHGRLTRRLLVSAALAALALGTLAPALGCASAPFVWVDDLPSAPQAEPGGYRIRPGDTLAISVWRQPEMTTTAWVRPDGKISVPLGGDIEVVGLTPGMAAKTIEAALEGKVTAPVTVVVSSSSPRTVAVLGEVETPGRYPIQDGDTVLDGLAYAGGLTEFARKDHVYVLRRGEARRIRFSFTKLTGAVGRGILFTLEDGDIIVVE